MGLREDATRAYKGEKEARETKDAAEKRERIDKRIRAAQTKICQMFALVEPPPFVVVYSGEKYWPDVTFEVEGIMFGYDLDDEYAHVKVSCPKCQGEWSRSFRISVDSNGVRDLTGLGSELSMPADPERHACPADHPPPPPRPEYIPPKTVEYRHGSVEHNLLDSIREYVEDRIEERMGDR